MTIEERLERIESLLSRLIGKEPAKEAYSVADVAKIVGRSQFQVREWCRLGRIKAKKKECGRSRAKEWMIPAGELAAYQSFGLRPMGR